MTGCCMQKPALLLITTLLGLSLSGCASLMGDSPGTVTGQSPKPVADAPAGRDQAIRYAEFEPEVLFLLLSAEIAAQRGRYDVTLVNYVNAAKQSRDRGVIERAMRIAQSLGGDNAQRQLAELWLEVDPDSLPAHRVFAIQAVKGNDLQTALRHMERIMDLGGDADFDSLAAMSSRLPPQKQLELLSLYQQLSERHPGTPELEYSIALLLKVTGNPEAALEQLAPLLERQPNFQPAIILNGDLLYQTDQQTTALDYLLKNTRRFPDNRQMGTLYGRMLIGEGELQAAQDEFQRLMSRFPEHPSLRLSHALVALENNQVDLARRDLTRLIEQGYHTNEAHFYLGKIADAENDPEQAIGYYEQVEEGSHYFPALARVSELKAQAGDLDGALKHLRVLREANPQLAENFWLLEVNLLLDQGAEERALELASKALEDYPENVRLRYARAMLLDSAERAREAEQDLRRILEQEPDNAVALNALGYILTTRTDRYGEAQMLIEQALHLDPENPAILDSMGWVLFQQGRDEEALKYLEQAYSSFPDPEVAAHYGEVLWQTGEKDQARIVWKEGLEQDPDHPILLETVRRFVEEQEL